MEKNFKIILKKTESFQIKQTSGKFLVPSNIAKPVWVMTPPLHAKFLPNNQWMYEYQEQKKNIEINIEGYIYEWWNLYSILSSIGIVYLLPSVPNLQDLHFVNSFVYLSHLKDKNICIISRFKAKGRSGEEKVIKEYLESMGYECYQPPIDIFFEGEPCLRWVRDDIYLGSYGERTSYEALKWIEKQFNCKVFKLGLETGKLFHGDCIFLPITPYVVMVGINHVDKNELKELEKYVEIVPVEDEDLLNCGVCNNIIAEALFLAGDLTLAARYDLIPLDLAKKTKNFIEKIAIKYGLEPVFIPLVESIKQGGLLSCYVARLNWIDRYAYIYWKNGKDFLTQII